MMPSITNKKPKQPTSVTGVDTSGDSLKIQLANMLKMLQVEVNAQ